MFRGSGLGTGVWAQGYGWGLVSGCMGLGSGAGIRIHVQGFGVSGVWFWG